MPATKFNLNFRFEHECARLQAIIDQLEYENKELKIQVMEI